MLRVVVHGQIEQSGNIIKQYFFKFMSLCNNFHRLSSLRKLLIISLLILSGCKFAYGYDYVKKIERWDKRQKYERMARRIPRMIKKSPNDPFLYYYASLSELKISDKHLFSKRGYKHLLRSVNYYEIYKSLVSAPDTAANLQSALHTKIINFYRHFDNKHDDVSRGVLDYVLASFFNDTTDTCRSSHGEGQGRCDTVVTRYRSVVVSEALKHLGKPYKYAAVGPDSFDCSGFTRFVYMSATGLELPHNSAMQAGFGHEIPIGDARPGDLIFFGNTKTRNITHTGIVIDTGVSGVSGVIHCSNSGVVIDNGSKASWTKHWHLHIVKVVTLESLIE